MAELTDPVRKFIVQRLACYRTPSQVSADVLEEFGLAIDRRQVQKYHPLQCDKAAGRWLDLFNATRKAYLADTARVGVAQQVYRLEVLDAMLREELEATGPEARDRALKILEQAAREAGGSYTNTRTLGGKVGVFDLGGCTDDQLRRISAGEDPLAVMAGGGGR